MKVPFTSMFSQQVYAAYYPKNFFKEQRVYTASQHHIPVLHKGCQVSVNCMRLCRAICGFAVNCIRLCRAICDFADLPVTCWCYILFPISRFSFPFSYFLWFYLVRNFYINLGCNPTCNREAGFCHEFQLPIIALHWPRALSLKHLMTVMMLKWWIRFTVASPYT